MIPTLPCEEILALVVNESAYLFCTPYAAHTQWSVGDRQADFPRSTCHTQGFQTDLISHLPLALVVAVTTRPSIMAESVSENASWQYDYIDHYRLDENIIVDFLEQKWGRYRYYVRRMGDEFRFWVPRALNDDEKNALIERRKPTA